MSADRTLKGLEKLRDLPNNLSYAYTPRLVNQQHIGSWALVLRILAPPSEGIETGCALGAARSRCLVGDLRCGIRSGGYEHRIRRIVP